MSTPLDNWRWVPVEATEEMLAAGDKIMDCDPQWVRRGYMAMLAAAPHPPIAQPQAAGWRPIETAPRDGKKLILFYLNRNNLPRTVMARWLTDEQAAETDADGVGLEGGWYECIDNWDDYTEVAIHEGEPTHWQPLPEPPKEGV